MEVIAHEVSHALARGGSGQHIINQAGDPGEHAAYDAGRQFKSFVSSGAKGTAPQLKPAHGGRAAIHRFEGGEHKNAVDGAVELLEKTSPTTDFHNAIYFSEQRTAINLGSVLSLFLGQAEQGLVHLRRAAELAPEQPYIHGAVAAPLSSRGQDEEARQALVRQVELNQAVDRELAQQSARRRPAELFRGLVLGLGFAGCTLAGGYVGSRQLDDQSGWSVVVFIVSLIAGMLLSPALLLPLSLVLEGWQAKRLSMPTAPGDSSWLELPPDDLENPIIKAALAEQQAKAPNADA